MAGDRQKDDRSSDDQFDLSDFSGRLAEARGEHDKRHAEVAATTHGLAMRLGSDFFAGIVVGGLLGWGIDRIFGTSPWGLIICLGLGFVTGTRLAIRSAKEINERAADSSQD